MTVNTFPFLRTSNDVQLELCQRARRLRLQKNITQTALAKVIGVSIGTLKNFENKGEIQLSAFLRIMEYYNRLAEMDKIMQISDVPESLFDYKEPPKRLRARGKK